MPQWQHFQLDNITSCGSWQECHSKKWVLLGLRTTVLSHAWAKGPWQGCWIPPWHKVQRFPTLSSKPVVTFSFVGQGSKEDSSPSPPFVTRTLQSNQFLELSNNSSVLALPYQLCLTSKIIVSLVLSLTPRFLMVVGQYGTFCLLASELFTHRSFK